VAEEAGEKFPDEALVVRGGRCLPGSLQSGTSEHFKVPGVTGFSVQCEPGATVAELARAGQFPHGSVGVTSVGRIRELGLEVRRTPGLGHHATVVTGGPLQDALAEALSAIFEVEKNPLRS